MADTAKSVTQIPNLAEDSPGALMVIMGEAIIPLMQVCLCLNLPLLVDV